MGNTKETVLKPDLECFYWLGYFLSFDHVPWCAVCGRLFSYKVWKRTSARRIKWSRWQINSLHSLHKNTFKNILGSDAKKLKTKLTKRTNKNSVSTKTKMLYHWCVLLMLLDPMTESPETYPSNLSDCWFLHHHDLAKEFIEAQFERHVLRTNMSTVHFDRHGGLGDLCAGLQT